MACSTVISCTARALETEARHDRVQTVRDRAVVFFVGGGGGSFTARRWYFDH